MRLCLRADSLTTRLILLGSALLLVGALGRMIFLSSYLRNDLTQLTSAQLTSIAHYAAQDVDRDIVARRDLLTHLASKLPPALLGRPAQLRAWLQERQETNPLFSRGLFVLDTAGQIIADFPAVPGRAGSSAADRDYFRQASQGHLAVGQPTTGRIAPFPILPMAAPLLDDGGSVRGILVGVSELQSGNFLATLYTTRIGKTGGLLLISPRDKLFVGASDPTMILAPTPAPGINPLHDLAMNGFRGTGITVNAKGVEEIVATASVPSLDWFVVARLPTSEAHGSVSRLIHYILRNTVIILPLFILAMILIMRRMMRPLMETAKRADRMTQGELPLEPLPVARNDEVGHLTAAFNRVLSKLLESQAELSHMAHHDQLTGLPNRKLLADRMKLALARAHRNDGWVAVLFLDLDGFKPINDRHGHETGDLALREVANRLLAVIRREDTLARVGGDEFVVLLSDLDASAGETAERVADKCLAVFATPFDLPAGSCVLGTSIGIAIGDGNCDQDRLLIAADQAMYRAKEAGRGRYCLA
ncbi:GGDEF domain-containing protein [Azonexus hydrophilus]|uniref:GGDEF domain-containing protein n=1 Tax=Azonexus hydrophilus TaxID=418702 RepID=A0ABZ2XG16_9RHOO